MSVLNHFTNRLLFTVLFLGPAGKYKYLDQRKYLQRDRASFTSRRCMLNSMTWNHLKHQDSWHVVYAGRLQCVLPLCDVEKEHLISYIQERHSAWTNNRSKKVLGKGEYILDVLKVRRDPNICDQPLIPAQLMFARSRSNWPTCTVTATIHLNGRDGTARRTRPPVFLEGNWVTNNQVSTSGTRIFSRRVPFILNLFVFVKSALGAKDQQQKSSVLSFGVVVWWSIYLH
ncbi:hypothetical protein PROFUN_14455 [Planoprotostelium fungivorum]|uniref:Uncharacterized protein n=1 Tax=Planoprotostelium fungivorum TaxID=1890364 RepID=A0A2P6MX91_9EUKA|nr:hypothetical protein PROFUN_14455 [Planoprotostelium fungivorum]